VVPLAQAGSAKDNVIERPLVSRTLEQFNEESGRIREQMQPGGLYDHIRSGDKARVEAGLDRMQRLLQAHTGQGELPRADSVALANAQEEVNGILRHNDNNRLVCESRAPVGSHIPVTSCRTYGEVEETRRATVKQMDEMNALSRSNYQSLPSH